MTKIIRDTRFSAPKWVGTVPSSPQNGDTWWDTTRKKEYVYLSSTSKWYECMQPVTGGDTGYSIGHQTNFSTLERFNFPFESGTTVLNALAAGGNYAAGCNSTQFGYVFGGYNAINGYHSIIQKINFATDIALKLSTNLFGTSRYGTFGFNSSQNGYCAGGSNGSSYMSYIDRIPFYSDSTISISSYINSVRAWGHSVNSSQHGFLFGGMITSSSSISLIDRIIFSSDSSTSVSVGNLTVTRSVGSSFNSSIAGYNCGGQGSVSYSSIEKIVFPFASGTATTISNLSSSKYYSGGSNSSLHGFCIGGYSSSYLSSIDRMIFASDTSTCTIINNISAGTSANAGIDNTDFCAMFI